MRSVYYRPARLLYRVGLRVWFNRKRRLKSLRRSRATLRRLGFALPGPLVKITDPPLNGEAGLRYWVAMTSSARRLGLAETDVFGAGSGFIAWSKGPPNGSWLEVQRIIGDVRRAFN